MTDSMYNLALLFYEVSSHNKEVYKLNEDKWWYISVTDVQAHIKDPVEGKSFWQQETILFYLLVFSCYKTVHFKSSSVYLSDIFSVN